MYNTRQDKPNKETGTLISLAYCRWCLYSCVFVCVCVCVCVCVYIWMRKGKELQDN